MGLTAHYYQHWLLQFTTTIRLCKGPLALCIGSVLPIAMGPAGPFAIGVAAYIKGLAALYCSAIQSCFAAKQMLRSSILCCNNSY